MKRFFISVLVILFVSFIGYSVYCDYTTPETYIKTEYFDGYIKDNFNCSKHSTTFIDTKTNKTIKFKHGSYMSNHYSGHVGDHIQLTRITTKKTTYHYKYKLIYNGKELDTYYWSVGNLQIK